MGALLKLLNGFSYKEKSVLISLLAVAGIYGAYFIEVLGGEVAPTLGAMLSRMIGMVVALIIVHVAYHIVISLDDVDEAEDERDKAVSRRASVFGYNVLFVAVLLVVGRMLLLGAWAEQSEASVAPSLFEIANLLLLGLVAAEIVYYAGQLFFYRRGLVG